MMAKFDSKSFNAEAFGKYVERIPNVKKNQLIQSGAVGTNDNAKTALASQTGSLYARIPYFGRISGDTSQNNDGATNITSTSTTTYEQGFVTASRMDSWTELMTSVAKPVRMLLWGRLLLIPRFSRLAAIIRIFSSWSSCIVRLQLVLKICGF